MAAKHHSEPEMANPYDDYGAHPDSAHIDRRFAWGALVVFLLVLTVAPVWRNAYEIFRGEQGSVPMVKLFRFDPDGHDAKRGKLFQHLRQVESEFEDAAFTRPLRRGMQSGLTALLREGNRRTVIGRDGWLYFKPAIDGLTGYGPLKPEPDTVAKDPTLEPWDGPLGAITRFAEQLDEFGVELVLVPIPVKPMIYPEHLGVDAEAPLRHRDAQAFYTTLEEAGIDVIDLSDDMVAWKARGPVFLKQDTHWTPAGMAASAARVADVVRAQTWYAEWSARAPITVGEVRDVASAGDLVERLGLPLNSTAFAEETAAGVTEVVAGAEPVSIYDQGSPVVLLGDSFTNIYSDKSMGWGENSGFAQHLSRELGLTIDTIAQNGGAATDVRRMLASRRGIAQSMRDTKKVVVWAIASRDLFLSETPAREANVFWKDVTIGAVEDAEASSPGSSDDGVVQVRARLTMKSSFANPQDVPYPDALYACEYEVIEVVEGAFEAPSVLVFHWAFRERRLLPSANYQEGDEWLLTLVPFDQKSELQSVNQSNDSFELDLPVMWAEAVVDPAQATAEAGDDTAAPSGLDERAAGVRAGWVAAIFAILLVSSLVIGARRYERLVHGHAPEGA